MKTNKVELIGYSSHEYYNTDNNKLLQNIMDENNVNSEAIDLNIDSEEEKSLAETHKLVIKNEEIIQLKEDEINKYLEEHGFEILDQGFSNNEHIVKSRARGTSITDINWGEVTKKFIFG